MGGSVQMIRKLFKFPSAFYRMLGFCIVFFRMPISLAQKTYLFDILVAGYLLSQTIRKRNRPERAGGFRTGENLVTLVLQGWHLWVISQGFPIVFAVYLMVSIEVLYYLSRGVVNGVGVKTQTLIGI